MNKKILVTGSSGFIGYHVCKELLKQGYQILGVDNHNSYYDVSLKEKRCNDLKNQPNFKFNKIHLEDSINLESTISLYRPNSIIHLAAQAGVRYSVENPSSYIDSNIEGFYNVLEAARKFDVGRLIFASSSSVYGNLNNSAFKEEQLNLNPSSLYGATKLFNEKIAKKYSENYGMQVIGLRFFSVFGPLGRPDMAYFLFSNNLNLDKEIILFNNGEMKRDMTYIDDIVSGIMLSLKYKLDNAKFELFNLGNNKPIKTMSLLNFIEAFFNKKAKIINKESFNESISTCADLSLSSANLGYQPKVNFEEGMEKFLVWYKRFYGY